MKAMIQIGDDKIAVTSKNIIKIYEVSTGKLLNTINDRKMWN